MLSEVFTQLHVEARLELESWHPASFKTIIHVKNTLYSRKVKKYFNDNQKHILAEYNFKTDTLEEVENV